jgi:hypothetical protein
MESSERRTAIQQYFGLIGTSAEAFAGSNDSFNDDHHYFKVFLRRERINEDGECNLPFSNR